MVLPCLMASQNSNKSQTALVNQSDKATACSSFNYNQETKRKSIVELNYEDNSIKKIDSHDLERILNQKGYKEIKSSFKSTKLLLFLKIRWKYFVFKFDPKQPDFVQMIYTKKLPFLKSRKIELSATEYVHLSQSIAIDDKYYSVPIKVSKKKYQYIGIKVIEAFDWLIDFNKKKVYIRKNAKKIESEEWIISNT